MTQRDPRYPEASRHGGIEGCEPAFVDVDGVRTRYYDVGNGDPLVLVHGGNWHGHASANKWTKTFEFLADRFRVLAFDRIGCGMTDNPSSPDAFRYSSELRHAIGFLDALDLDTVHLCGYSRGAGLATRVAVEIPDRIETLAITNSATLGPPIGDERYRHDRVFRMEEMGLERTDPAYIRHRLEQYSYRTDYITEERCQTAAYMESRPKARRTARVMEEDGRIDDWMESLSAHMAETRRRISSGVLDVPVLYVFGRNDLTVPFEMATRAFDLFGKTNPQVRLRVLNDCGHMIFLEHPAEFSRLLTDFVDFHG